MSEEIIVPVEETVETETVETEVAPEETPV
jgi:hypothetical protein